MFVVHTRCFKFLKFGGHIFPTYVVDDLVALVLGSGFQTSGLDYLMTENMFCTISPIPCMILHMPRLSTANENPHTCETLFVDSE